MNESLKEFGMLDSLWQFITGQWTPSEHYISVDPWSSLTLIYSNVLIAASYFLIPLILVNRARSKHNLRASTAFWLFFLFNVIYGWTKLVLVWNIYHPSETVGPVIRIISALAASGSVVILWSFVPKILRMPSTESLEDINEQLQAKNEELENAYASLQTERDDKERAQANLLQSQKLDAVGQLTGGFAHDFNNLLLAVSGNLELLKHNPTSDRTERWITTALDAVSRAAHLTAQLLTFSRSQKLQLKKIVLRPLITNVKDLIVRTIGPDIQVKVTSFDDVLVEVDPVQLELAILNLALNARDAMPDGGSLIITTTVIDNRVEIDVTDTGHGIPEEFVTRVFEPFFTTKEVGKGVGLGLSMVHGAVSQFGGNVFIKRTNSAGTRITISLPIASPDEDIDSSLEGLEDSETSGKNILLVDDDQAVRETLSEILKLLGHVVYIAESGVKALRYLENNKPDMILLDYAMPHMDGAEVSKAAQQIYADVPIIFVTGYSDSDEIMNFKVLKKPFSIKDIDDLLKVVFDEQDYDEQTPKKD